MSDEGSGVKGAIALIAAVILIVSAFSFFTVRYPGISAAGQPHGGNYRLFEYQINDTNLLGLNRTGFSPISQTAVLVEGTITNSSSGSPVSLSKLYVAKFPVETVTDTDNSGFYSYYIRYTGTGNFAYKVPGYHSAVVQMTAKEKTVWENVSLSPIPKFAVSGTVKDIYGNRIAGVNIVFSNYYQTVQVQSDSSGIYSARLCTENYSAQAYGAEYRSFFFDLAVGNRAVPNYNLTMSPAVAAPFTVSGFVRNSAGMPVQGASVRTFPVLNGTISNATGYFSLNGMYGFITINTTAPGYNVSSTGQIYVSSSIAGLSLLLQPVSSIGNGLLLFNLSTAAYSGDPAVNTSSLLSALSSFNPTGPYSGVASSASLTITAGGSPLASAQYIAFIDSDGIFYRGLFSTTSGGSGVLYFNYSGIYAISILMLYYGSYTVSGSFSGTQSIYPVLSPSATHTLSVDARDAADSFPVPPSGMTIANSLFQIGYISSSFGNSTYFNYTVPDGEYLLSYSNAGYLNAFSVANVTGTDTNASISLYPYAMKLIGNSNLTWNVSLTHGGSLMNATVAPLTSVLLHVVAGNYTITAAALGLSYVVTSSAATSASYPIAFVYLNETDAYSAAGRSSFRFTNTSGTTGIVQCNFTFNFTSKPGILLGGVSLPGLNFTLVNSSVTSSVVAFNFTGNSTTFTVPFVIGAGSVTFEFSSGGLLLWQAQEILTMGIDYSYVLIEVQDAVYAP